MSHIVDTVKLKNMGLNLIPLQVESKLPIKGVNWKKFQTEKFTGEFPDSCNVAVICGAISENLFVVDLDSAELFDSFKEYHNETFIVKTGRGYHLYFRTNGFLPPNKKYDDYRFRHIDIKSEGGYVLAPGSIHPDTKKPYEIISDKPIMFVQVGIISDKLKELGFNVETKTIEEIKNGVSEGNRNDSTFKYACHCVRDDQLYGEALRKAVEDMNARNKPPLPQNEIDIILSQALKYESHNIKVIKKEESTKEEKPKRMNLRDITPEFEGVLVEFDAMIIGTDEKETYTKEADTFCPTCGDIDHVECDEFHNIIMPYCKKDKKTHLFDRDSLVTGYIQSLRIQEFLEDARNSTPEERDAEIIDENVGEAFMIDKKTFTARFRSIPSSKGNNTIVFEVVKMKDLEQKKDCMPEDDEVKKWKSNDNIYERVRDSISSELYINPAIKESLMLSAIGGTSLNNKRTLIHVAMLGDAQTGKSELLKKMHKLLPGSGYAVGGKVSSAGLTMSMVTSHKGVRMPQAGLLPTHTGDSIVFDEGDKCTSEILNSLLECMEQETATMAKSGNTKPGISLPASCQIMFAGNPKNGRYNPKYTNVMDNFTMETPFISRFDVLWLMRDQNDPEVDKIIRKIIRNYDKNKSQFMDDEEIQRYFTYVKTLKPKMTDNMFDKMDELHTKMRILNKGESIPIGWRQYYGLERLLTASAAAHLREEVTDEDFEIVEKIIDEAYKSLNMNLETGEVKGSHQKSKDSKRNIILETWSECTDEDGTVDKDEFIIELGKHEPFNAFNSGEEFDKLLSAGKLVKDNDTERWKMVSN